MKRLEAVESVLVDADRDAQALARLDAERAALKERLRSANKRVVALTPAQYREMAAGASASLVDALGAVSKAPAASVLASFRRSLWRLGEPAVVRSLVALLRAPDAELAVHLEALGVACRVPAPSAAAASADPAAGPAAGGDAEAPDAGGAADAVGADAGAPDSDVDGDRDDGDAPSVRGPRRLPAGFPGADAGSAGG